MHYVYVMTMNLIVLEGIPEGKLALNSGYPKISLHRTYITVNTKTNFSIDFMCENTDSVVAHIE